MQDRFMFRTYSVETKQMRYLSNFTSGRDFYYAIFMDNRALGVGTHIVMQCTGLKDKNGKPIYEGDVIQDTIIPEYFYVVEWNNGGFSLKSTIGNSFRLIDTMRLEVIGNIYENPELLRG